jgi:hypothetical protein
VNFQGGAAPLLSPLAHSEIEVGRTRGSGNTIAVRACALADHVGASETPPSELEAGFQPN